jgi:hypothetical protein
MPHNLAVLSKDPVAIIFLSVKFEKFKQKTAFLCPFNVLISLPDVVSQILHVLS